MTQAQRKGVFITSKNQRSKGGYVNLKENQLQIIKSPEVDLNDIDELSETNSAFEVPTGLLKRRVIYENTYKRKPDHRFPVTQVENIIHEVLVESFQHESYDIKTTRELIKNVSQTLKDRVKEMDIPRYKLVVTVHIGENKGQNVKIASRCLWNEEYDTFATASLQNSSLFAQASVFGVYFE